MQVTIDIPDELARKLEAERPRVADIIALGLNEFAWIEHEVDHCPFAEEIVSFLARRPTPDDRHVRCF